MSISNFRLSGLRLSGFAAALALSALTGCAQHQPAVQSAVTNTPEPPLATKPTVGQEISAVAENKVQITFPEGGYQLSPEANQELDVAARLFRDVHPVVMFTMGYTDSKGDEFNNIVLSAKRARIVKKALIARGIPPDRLLIQAFGDSDPAKSTDPLAAENRRVVIMWRLL